MGNPELLADLNNLRKENQSLRDAVATSESRITPEHKRDLASLDEAMKVTLEFTVRYGGNSHKQEEVVQTTWVDMFARIAPCLVEHPNDTAVNFRLGSSLYRGLHPGSERTVQVNEDDFETIRVQFCALNLVAVTYTQTTKGGMALFWGLTQRGQDLMIQLRTVKAPANNASGEAKDRKET